MIVRGVGMSKIIPEDRIIKKKKIKSLQYVSHTRDIILKIE